MRRHHLTKRREPLYYYATFTSERHNMTSARTSRNSEVSGLRDYDSRLADAVSVAAATATTFEDLCHRVCGAAPKDILQHISEADLNRLEELRTEPLPSRLDSRIPEPHPIDYDWRFDGPTAETLANIARRFDNVLCVGTPTVFDLIAQAGGRASLVDRNPFLAKALTQTRSSRLFLDEISHVNLLPGTFDAAILDPPWYPPIYDAWLSKVIPALRPGGSVFLVMFRNLTRPSAQDDLELLSRHLANVGEVSVLSSAATYITPRFEVETLQRQHLPLLSAWRQGDILQVNLSSAVKSWPRINNIEAPPKRSWRRFLLGNQVVMTAINPGDDGPIAHRGIEGREAPFELMSVSDRDPRRLRVNFWTSRNKGAEVTGIERVAAILSEIAESPKGQHQPRRVISQDDRLSFRRLIEDTGLDSGAMRDA